MGVDISLVFRVINCIVAAFMVVGAVGKIISVGFPNFITGIFCIIFGIVTAVFEFRLPAQVTQYASFMFSFLGRGLFYIFIGCITLNYEALTIASGVIIIVVGVAYVVLHFVPGIQAPINMQKSAFEESLGYSTRPTDEGGVNPSGASYNAGSYPTKTYVSDGPTV
ncbi:COPI associated protein-domain-containing protein [Zychaea mexicana]|uniref:COPI associated protein-domain-containing protein n=1 Tax=Zychaea mexicana TaxID=64656 RepID=UPI0022FF44CF|nr:COPI associated protein-domain-containing protein [Zychaea mexicana]KAI9492583.1 COPI associated protein-domain-containing protein [Zychaea mexicana]